MAARKNRGVSKSVGERGWDQNVRNRIKSSMLVNFLQDHVANGTDVKKTQITAAVALLKKTIPDLQSTELSGSLSVSLEERLKELE